jgi:hypothetical protein
MGYYTVYRLKVRSGKAEDAEIIQAHLDEISGYRQFFGHSIKWYHHTAHCLEASKKYRDIAFSIYGSTEDDIFWRSDYAAGKIEFEREFDSEEDLIADWLTIDVSARHSPNLLKSNQYA